MNLQLQEAIVDEFKAVLISDDKKRSSETNLDILQKALQHGVLINPECFIGQDDHNLKKLVDYIIGKCGINANKLNSTFYKRFSDVENRSELQLRTEQLLHYISTYDNGYEGTNGQIYEPEFLRDIDLDVKHQLTYIDAITKEQLVEKVKNMLTSGIALSELTQVRLLMMIEDLKLKIDYVDRISNREFMCRLCKKLGLLPQDFDEFTRYMIYLVTGSTLLIKSKTTYNQLAMDGLNSVELQHAFNQYVNTFGIEQVAKNITRYRKLYLLIRKHLINKKDLNKALKLSKKLYVPRKQSPLEHVMDANIEDIEQAVKHAPIYKLVKVFNASVCSKNVGARYFKIRNGKSFLKIENKSNNDVRLTKGNVVAEIILKEIKERLGSWSNKVFYIPEGIDYAVPTSAKDFVGSLPYMSKYHFKGKKLSIGIAWEQQGDLDLHAMTLDGRHVGWNGSFLDSGIMFSGDMTNLNRYGYAAEFFEINPAMLSEPLIITANHYFSMDDAIKFDIFSTGVPIDAELKQGVATQIDADSVLLHDKLDSHKDRSKTLAIVIPANDGGCDVVYTAVSFGNVHVPGVNNTTKQLIKVMKNQAENTLMLRQLINLLGGHVISNTNELCKLLTGKDRYNTEISTKGNMYTYIHLDYSAPEIFNLSPDEVTASTFIDLLKEPEED
ncbi:hypothetical protein [Limosilactobacillus agrestimuris]|uniref:hypothetical protein n=1 Tax=Limosilactobacillus agrestimuris TaxID=2941331 RepID=UPI0020400923|nr:hypothetical protein [Limosilactobacillus agrestimuris]